MVKLFVFRRDRAQELPNVIVGHETNAHGYRALHPVHREALEKATFDSFISANRKQLRFHKNRVY